MELIKKVARDLLESKYAIAFTGAGISTESGIPDFRGPFGIWKRDPEAERRAYKVYTKFLKDPREYWIEVQKSTIYPIIDKALPNSAHRALSELEELGKIMCIITQNIDGLHHKAGSKNVIEFHGSVSKLRCICCGSRFDKKEFINLIESGRVPKCKICENFLKLDVVHFNEPIPPDIYIRSFNEVMRCDLMLVCGTSAVVYPAAELPRIAKRYGAKVIEINLEETTLTFEGVSDYIIKGRVGEILPKIAEEVKRSKKE
ncbi:MAG: NAD-dependent deacylase [Archaeoglobaceae archaeon]|nr:NAD-dependent deacylase [Archaeoglobaceae archaeon]MDW7989846.1 NAD-dependent deacylase [Archaeoglobaceae archaeon]